MFTDCRPGVLFLQASKAVSNRPIFCFRIETEARLQTPQTKLPAQRLAKLCFQIVPDQYAMTSWFPKFFSFSAINRGAETLGGVFLTIALPVWKRNKLSRFQTRRR